MEEWIGYNREASAEAVEPAGSERPRAVEKAEEPAVTVAASADRSVAVALPPGKLFYTIGEVAAMFNVNTSLIRFWDKEFEVISPNRNRKGNRLFTPTDVAYFHKIYHWVKEEGYTLQGAKEKLKAKPLVADSAEEELLQRLHRVRKFLTDLKESL